ncbi:MAG: hypothetical protein Q8P44_00340, partial [Dehalococcoidia bacterium]|nr:hypothetical protein [Dehalococcoidia bacterium]
DLAKLVATPDTVTIYNVAVTGANTEYSQVLPANTKRFMVHLRDNAAFRLAFVTGKVATPTAPYFSVPANMAYSEDGINPAASTLYFASAVATKTAEIIAWS